MARGRHIQTNFTAGEFSPRLFGRVDLERYPNGARELMNLVMHPQGGAQRRTGSYYCGAVKTESERVRMVPFVASRTGAYAMEFGNLYLRFWRNRGPVMSGAVPLELVTPWPTAILRELRFTQSVDVLYIFHEDYEPRKLTRTTVDTFNLTTVVLRDGPYIAENTGNPTVSTGSGSTTPGGAVTPPTTGGSGTGGEPDPGGGGGDGGGGGSGDGGGDGGGGDGGGGGE